MHRVLVATLLWLIGCQPVDGPEPDRRAFIEEVLYRGQVHPSCGDALDQAMASGRIEIALRCPVFIDRVLSQFRLEYLQGISSEEILVGLIDLEQVKLSAVEETARYGEDQFQRLLAVYDAREDYLMGAAGLRDIQLRFLSNYFFEQINMGCTNQVSVAFLHLLGRLPTRSELDAGVDLCEGREAQLLFRRGSGYFDLLDILTTNGGYLEHQFRYWHEFLFFRQPETQVVAAWLEMYEAEPHDVESIIQFLLIHHAPND